MSCDDGMHALSCAVGMLKLPLFLLLLLLAPCGEFLVSVPAELTLGHLSYDLTDVPPQSNSPPDNVSTLRLITPPSTRPPHPQQQTTASRLRPKMPSRSSSSSVNHPPTDQSAEAHVQLGPPTVHPTHLSSHQAGECNCIPHTVCGSTASLPAHRARGSSPWRPDADMGTACHENNTASLGFSRAYKSLPDTTREVVLYGGDTPISEQPDSRGNNRPYKEKKTLPGTPADVSESVCVTAPDGAAHVERTTDRHHPSPFSLEYLLLPPRSAPVAAPPRLTSAASTLTTATLLLSIALHAWIMTQTRTATNPACDDGPVRVGWLVYHRTTDYPTPGTPCTRGNANPLTAIRDDGPPANPHFAGNTAATPHADKQPRAPLHCTCDSPTPPQPAKPPTVRSQHSRQQQLVDRKRTIAHGNTAAPPRRPLTYPRSCPPDPSTPPSCPSASQSAVKPTSRPIERRGARGGGGEELPGGHDSTTEDWQPHRSWCPPRRKCTDCKAHRRVACSGTRPTRIAHTATSDPRTTHTTPPSAYSRTHPPT
ncbi:rRNA promoter binding protein [Echinococcus multilocularis]|uniref:rRNA promoter binding protein n=1 Tax=Echinococcus multilocularis TaxID=6211 RepID=A0A0S4MKE2_ECHMU|nr:rRNA promoter binding protein [Echinococcus multilocularis]